MLRSRTIAGCLLVLAACNYRPASPTPGPAPSVPASPTSAVAPTTAPSSVPTDSAWTPPPHRIQIRTSADGRAEFYDVDSGMPFTMRGANEIDLVKVGVYFQDRLFSTSVWDSEAFRADMRASASRGYNTARIFFDSCNSGPTCIANPNGPGLVGAYLDNMVEGMRIAKEEGIYLQLTSNDIPDHGGYGDMANREASDTMAGYRNAHMLTASGHEAAHRYWTDLMAGLAERHAPFDAVLGWELLNEQWLFSLQPPLSLSSGMVEATAVGRSYDMADAAQKRQMVADSVLAYIQDLRQVILNQDPTALVTMGFFAPQFPNPTSIGDHWYVDTASLIQRGAELDYYDFHAYPGSDIPLAQIAENFGMQGYAHKPIVMGEVGAFRSQYDTVDAAARATTRWIADSCDLGFDGWLYWTFRAAPLAVGDATWGLTDEGNTLLDLMAPDQWTDPCTPVSLPTDNLALGANVTASRSLPDQPPAAAIDGDTNSQWGAGDGPPQWIELDLGAPHTVRQIRLLVAQYPEGATRHQIQIAGPDHAFKVAATLASNTNDNQWLEFTPETPLAAVRYVRVLTVQSPSWVSWKEIEVKGD
jgi:hypothetical protein